MPRFSKIAFLLVIAIFAGCANGQTPTQKLLDEWAAAKTLFFGEINKSLADVFSQIDKMESAARDAGDLDTVRKVKTIRSSFTDKAEFVEGLDRANYELLRKNATAALASKQKEIVTKLLQLKEDAAAETVNLEFKELSEPLLADVQARWTAALAAYKAELESAKSIVTIELDKLEAAARQAANLPALENVKKAREAFVTNGELPPNVSTAKYESQVKKAKEALAQTNTELVRSLLTSRHDAKAKELNILLSDTLDGISAVLEKEEDTRKIWHDRTYKWDYRRIKGKKWITEDIRTKTKVRELKELNSSPEYVELIELDRKWVYRLFRDHAEIFKDGHWQGSADGVWEKPEGGEVHGPDSRKIWHDATYKSEYRHAGGTTWEVIDKPTGKILRKARELERTKGYIEVQETDRSWRLRLYPNRAEIFKDDHWQPAATGRWGE